MSITATTHAIAAATTSTTPTITITTNVANPVAPLRIPLLPSLQLGFHPHKTGPRSCWHSCPGLHRVNSPNWNTLATRANGAADGARPTGKTGTNFWNPSLRDSNAKPESESETTSQTIHLKRKTPSLANSCNTTGTYEFRRTYESETTSSNNCSQE